MPWYGVKPTDQGTPAFGSAGIWSLSASTHKVGFVFKAPKTGTLNRFGFRSGTGVASAPDVRLSFQNLSGANPDETQDEYADVAGIAASSWIEPASYMGSGGGGSGSKRSVTAGDWLACVVEIVNFAGGDTVDFATNGVPFDLDVSVYTNVKNTGSWAISTNGRGNLVALLYDGDTLYTPIAKYWGALHGFTNEGNFSSSTNPDERGMRFAFAEDVEIDGIELGVFALGTADADLVIYDDANSVLLTKTLDAARLITTNNGMHRVPFEPIALTGGDFYRAVVKATSASTVANIKTFSVPSNGLMSSLEPGTNDWYYTTRNDGGAWSNDTTKRPWFRLHTVNDAVVGGGGPGGAGGLLVNPGLNGGFL
jgi:hypothetical protein